MHGSVVNSKQGTQAGPNYKRHADGQQADGS